MAEKDDGGPAFPGFEYSEGRGPCRVPGENDPEYFSTGMTLRDYFAAKAMVLFIPCPASGIATSADNIAKCAYKVADAMLAERSK